ncbi:MULTISPECIES: helix-turn-helix transcriptional regulator [unclassified Shinella]|uniref:helix-turn-helix transcriptional regulator n=1 Tax=unclassified Shinella TaxID=2643062 RepID=UPI00225D4DBE|nr:MULTISPECIES: YafY family protein [unclassified Shinella]CAI0334139.1 YafY family transcriptional regulator [Rhizobiaceae bacterium]CAK7261793.1 DNA-binding protein [Shinella sp. WSC3-e]MDC7259703.1 YafY family transcriptional regulator [Shinella sp. YE25]MDC7266883.1 YafY family transcriptional regulator [Shinella sp. HY16]MDC7273780.1 YafY family transcriptional regulator [Shinella sp. YZ44]
MRSADRLFQIIQILRRTSRPVTAAAIAAEIEVSRRTVYRDIAELIGQRVPIQGEAGLGYVLADDYEMPPLALSPEEAEAFALGAQWVARHPDRALARLAQDVLSKIRFALPECSRFVLEQPTLGIRPLDPVSQERPDTTLVRDALRRGRVLAFSYRSLEGTVSQRSVWPILLGYDDTHCLLIAWCERRDAIRHFRAERMFGIRVLERKPPRRRRELLELWQKTRERVMSDLNSVQGSESE